jgi:hypothetical protein
MQGREAPGSREVMAAWIVRNEQILYCIFMEVCNNCPTAV